ncbi:hypothetical protein EA473_04230 [Natrarchaeobius chitinivorans]|uniref:Uncharacterized protein n=1 Tax=Natrarchaeobius chitinivorans TaxID=1679083 RepID=A0A3N6PCP3_NATCH|nr:hypothetical protein EA473_04230 [Natrarchaeobius chitinivorans]
MIHDSERSTARTGQFRASNQIDRDERSNQNRNERSNRLLRYRPLTIRVWRAIRCASRTRSDQRREVTRR